MGVYTGAIRFRTSLANQDPEQLCEFGNTFTEALLAAGMLPVSETDFAGQAGTYVTGVAGEGETRIIAAGSSNGVTTFGYNVFKHPKLNLYLQVFNCDKGYGTSHRMSLVSYVLWRGVQDGNGVTGSPRIYPLPQYPTSSSSWSLTVLPITYTDLFVSCGDDHICIYNKPNHQIPEPQYNYNASMSAGISFVGLGVFSDDENSDFLLAVFPQENQNTTTVSGVNMSGYIDQASIRNISSDSITGGAWEVHRNGSCCGFIHPEAQAVSGGVRVARSQLVIGGKKCSFNFGWINAATVTDAALIELDLIGETRKYRAAPGFGAGNHAYPLMQLQEMVAAFIPWSE